MAVYMELWISYKFPLEIESYLVDVNITNNMYAFVLNTQRNIWPKRVCKTQRCYEV